VAWFLALKKSLGVPRKSKAWSDWVFLVGSGILLLELGTAFWEFVSLMSSDLGAKPTLVSIVALGAVLLTSFLGVWSLPFVISTLGARIFLKRKLASWLNQLLLLLPTIPLLLLMGVISLFLFNVMGRHTLFASRYFKLHAAIKNTCLLDPQRHNCPTELVGISYIEPDEFRSLAADTDFVYRYDPATNQYTFIARPFTDKAVVFDQRLIPLIGVDFEEYDVVTDSSGQDRLLNPPPFSGPWELSKFKQRQTPPW
jgi:hypothetical protein